MEKFICPACGAPLSPDSTQPFITCEYCDTAVENKHYVAPAAAEPEAEPAEAAAAETLTDETEETQETSSGGILKTLLGVGTAIAANNLRRRTAVRRTSAPHPVMRSGHPSTPHRHPEPPRVGGMGVRSARPSRPQPGRSSMHGGMGGRGMGGPGGRGGRGGPGGRHR